MNQIEKNIKTRSITLTVVVILMLCIIACICFGTAIRLKATVDEEERTLTYIEEINLYNLLDSKVGQAISLANNTANSTLLQNWITRYDDGEIPGDEIIHFLSNLVKTSPSTNAVLVSARTLDDYTDLGFNKTLSIDNEHDSWYFTFIDSNVPYVLHVDTEETRDNEKMLFVNHRIDSPSGALLGVCSIGVSFADVDRILAEYSVSENMSIFLLDRDGDIQFSHGDLDAASLDFSALAAKNALINGTSVEPNAEGGYTTMRYLDSLDWYLVTYTDETSVKDAFSIFQLNALLLFVVVLLVCLCCIVAFWWQREQQRVAEFSNKSKTEFLSRMSHDIRTPINGIKGMLHIAQANMDDPEKLSDALEKMTRTCHQLELLVNDVLEMSRIDSGHIELAHEEFCLPQILKELAPTVEVSAEQNAVALIGSHYEITHKWIIGSPMHLQRVILNLLSNALKYNHPGGSVEVWCREEATSPTTSNYIFTIQDTGIGMSPEFQKHMFEPFTRERQSSAVSGTGLGLAITKEMIELMGGKIEVQSQLGVGTRITVMLPFEVAAEHQAAVQRDNQSIADLRILLAEDNPLNAEITTYLLQERGASVTHAVNGREAVALFENAVPGTFDLILMDLMMPEMDGFEAAKVLRALPRLDAKTIPIIAMSANTFAEDVTQCLACGMNDHIAKPVDLETMAAKICQYVPARQMVSPK